MGSVGKGSEKIILGATDLRQIDAHYEVYEHFGIVPSCFGNVKHSDRCSKDLHTVGRIK